MGTSLEAQERDLRKEPGTWPDITFTVSSLAYFSHNPGRSHYEVAKRVLHYLKGTENWHLTLGATPSALSGSFPCQDWG